MLNRRWLLFTRLNRKYPPTPYNAVSPVLLIASHRVSYPDKERITRMFFEEFGVPGFAIYDAGLLALYAAGVLTGITVDIGYEKTGMATDIFRANLDITPIVDGQVVSNGQISVPLGGKHATQHLCNLLITSPPASATTAQLLPSSEITFDLAEEIKLSPIAEMTNIPSIQRKRNPFGLNSSGESTPLGTPDARDEGVDDIAQIVASGRMSEYFEKKEREKKEREKAARGRKGDLLREPAAQPKPNAELAHNTLNLKNGTSILVGGERFRVAEPLMEGISEPFDDIIMGLPDAVTLAVELACRGEHAGKRADLWQHMVIVGGGARIKGANLSVPNRLMTGFKEAFTAHLATRLPVQLMPGHENGVQGSSLLSQLGGAGTPINGGTGTNTPIPGGGGQTGMHPPGAIIRVLKIPDYFIEWRDTAANGEIGPGRMGAQEEAAFLGGQIVAKLSFNDPGSGNFVNKMQYATRGPAAILAL
jgi:actin-related protein 9